MTSGLITAVKSLRRIILFQLLVHLAPQRITWLLCYFKIDFISQEKRQDRDFGLNACLLLCGGQALTLSSE